MGTRVQVMEPLPLDQGIHWASRDSASTQACGVAVQVQSF